MALKWEIRGDYIGGEFSVPSHPDQTREALSPADDRDVLGVFAFQSSQADRAVEAARSAWKGWRKTSYEDRVSFLKRYQDVVKRRADELTEALAREVGKPLWEAKTEIGGMAAKLDVAISEVGRMPTKDLAFPDVLPNTNGYCRHKPLGVLAVLGPFNFPLHLPNGHILPALLHGNTIVFKPSEKTPLTGQLMAECFDEAGLPKGVFNLVQGAGATGAALCANRDVKAILFTGSYHVGQKIKEATVSQPDKLLALEMGGKNSAIVWEDAPLEQALLETIGGSFLTTGQRCSSTSKILIHEKVYDEFKDKFCRLTSALEVNHPMENPFMGPLIDGPAAQIYLDAVEESKGLGMEILIPADPPKLELSGSYVGASVCEIPSLDIEQIWKNKYLQDEIFGPNVGLMKVSDFDQAIEIANATEYGLVASVFTESETIYQQCWDDLETGLINWNKSTVGASSKLPFGGIKKSGNHQPTALFAGRYCSVPVASMEVPSVGKVEPKIPGLHWEVL